MSIALRVLLVAIAMLWPTTVTAQYGEMKQRFEDFLEAVNDRELERLEALVADDLVRHSQATPGVVITSREDFVQFLQTDFAAVPDSRIECPMTAIEGDLLAAWCTYSGTQEGAWGPFPPSGRRVDLDFASFIRFEADKIAEIWVTWDNVAALTQLGHLTLPTPEEAP